MIPPRRAASRAVLVLIPLFLSLGRTPASAQSFSGPGTRAQGMGGAFVAVADDASAVYWNPAGLASGAYFSLVLDGGTSQATPPDAASAGNRSEWMLALSMPALGISYYRLRTSVVQSTGPQQAGGAPMFRIESLVTHHAGATLVQSLTEHLAVGATGKLVRGTAGSAVTPAADAEALLDGADLIGRSSSHFDLDVGIMASGAMGKVGLTVRNVTEPSFETGGGEELQLPRQVRAGASVLLLPGWKVAADVDLTKTTTISGRLREAALGTETQVSRRLAARGGLRFNTAPDADRTPAVSVGGSYAVLGSFLIDAQVTTGTERVFRGWGVAGRFVY